MSSLQIQLQQDGIVFEAALSVELSRRGITFLRADFNLAAPKLSTPLDGSKEELFSDSSASNISCDNQLIDESGGTRMQHRFPQRDIRKTYDRAFLFRHEHAVSWILHQHAAVLKRGMCVKTVC